MPLSSALAITRSKGGSTGLSCGVPSSGDSVGFEFGADTRRMVVFSGPVVLPKAAVAWVGSPG
jgi:hypothetical protein